MTTSKNEILDIIKSEPIKKSAQEAWWNTNQIINCLAVTKSVRPKAEPILSSIKEISDRDRSILNNIDTHLSIVETLGLSIHSLSRLNNLENKSESMDQVVTITTAASFLAIGAALSAVNIVYSMLSAIVTVQLEHLPEKKNELSLVLSQIDSFKSSYQTLEVQNSANLTRIAAKSSVLADDTTKDPITEDTIASMSEDDQKTVAERSLVIRNIFDSVHQILSRPNYRFVNVDKAADVDWDDVLNTIVETSQQNIDKN